MDLQLPIDTVEAIAMEMSDGKQCFAVSVFVDGLYL